MKQESEDLNSLDSAIRKLKLELEFLIGNLNVKENHLNEYEKMIAESENTYIKVMIFKNNIPIFIFLI